MKYRLFFKLMIAFVAMQYGCNRSTEYNGDAGYGTAWAPGSFSSNGERIYYTGTSERGTNISYSGGPDMGMMMMGGRLACVSCHGTDARGGRHLMHMAYMNSPDIRWTSLAGHHHEEESEKMEGAGHEAEHHHEDYGFEDFKNSVEKGKHPDGETLSGDMPRWHMSDADLKDLMKYLKSLE